MTFDLLAQNLPVSLSRERRIALLVEAADALLNDREVPHDAAAYVGRALANWLTHGGNLERDFLRVSAAPGSHRTPTAIARHLIHDERKEAHPQEENTSSPIPVSSHSFGKKLRTEDE